jgi:hypothetical protein
MAEMQQPPVYYQVAQAETEAVAPQPEQIDVSKLFPATAVSGEIRITVVPPSGSVLIFSEGKIDEAVRFKGPASQATIPLSGGLLYVKKVDGATDWTLEVIKWQGAENPK